MRMVAITPPLPSRLSAHPPCPPLAVVVAVAAVVQLVAAIAPSIWELDDVKRGILCQLFGGNSKVRGNDGFHTQRNGQSEKANFWRG